MNFTVFLQPLLPIQSCSLHITVLYDLHTMLDILKLGLTSLFFLLPNILPSMMLVRNSLCLSRWPLNFTLILSRTIIIATIPSYPNLLPSYYGICWSTLFDILKIELILSSSSSLTKYLTLNNVSQEFVVSRTLQYIAL